MTTVQRGPEGSSDAPRDLAAEQLRARLRAKMFQVRESGARVGRFTITEKIGAGGMGEVFAATEDGSGRRVAIKVLHSAVDDNQDSADGGATRLLREAKALARVDHPNVVKLFDVGTDNGRVYLAMELVEGPSIDAWVAASAPSRAEIVAAFVQAARGLGAAHTAGLVHRDVKPANLLVGPGGCVKVLDFGLARRLDAGALDVDESQWSETLTRPGDLMGTPGYMSPEHAASGMITAKSDQFGLCVALYEALFGVRPHEGASIPQLLQAIANGERRRVPRNGVPGHVRRAIERGLQTEPSDRFGTMEELGEALGSRSRRRSWRWAPFAVVATAGAVVGGWWMGHSASEADPVPPAGAAVVEHELPVGHGATVRMLERMESELEAATTRGEDSVPARIALAHAALSLGRFEQAREVLTSVDEHRGARIAKVWLVGALEHDAAAVRQAVNLARTAPLSGVEAGALELARGEALRRCDQPAAAAEAFAAARRHWASSLPPEDARRAWVQAIEAGTRAGAGAADPSPGVLREALALLRPALGDGHPRVGRAQVWLAEALAAGGRVEAARTEYAAALQTLRALGSEHPQWWAEATASAAAFELAQGQPEAARVRLEAVLGLAGASFERWLLLRLRGEAELALGEDAAASASFRRAAAELQPFAARLGTQRVLLALARSKASDGPGTSELQTELLLARANAAPTARAALATQIARRRLEEGTPSEAIAVLREEMLALGVGGDTAIPRARLLLTLAAVYGASSSASARTSALHEARALLRRHPDAAPGRVELIAALNTALRRAGPQGTAPRP